jgi:hypothetical protein
MGRKGRLDTLIAWADKRADSRHLGTEECSK